jgi:hypothetical protein
MHNDGHHRNQVAATWKWHPEQHIKVREVIDNQAAINRMDIIALFEGTYTLFPFSFFFILLYGFSSYIGR